MIKEALKYVVDGIHAKVEQVNGQAYSSYSKLDLLPAPRPNPLRVRNLSGLVDFIKINYDKQDPVLIHVVSPTEVNVYSTYNQDMQRNHLLQAEALLPSIPFESYMDLERFNVLLQSCFVPNEHRASLLSIAGSVTDSQVLQVGDDGVSQQVTAKTGVAVVGNAPVPNPVDLKPYRTFVDILQPESQFIFRMRSGQGQSGPTAALHEADGGTWKLIAIHSIRNYLAEELSEQIISGQATIIA